MKRYIARATLLSKLPALALLTLCFVQPLIGAHAPETAADPMPLPIYDHRDGSAHIPIPPMGFVFGQTIRITVAHVRTDSGQDQTPPDIRVGVWLLDAQGRVIAQSEQLQIPRNEFRSFDFNRAALTLPGEPGTGRLQVHARVVMHVAEPYQFTDDPNATGLLVPSLELIDNSTGRTAAACGGSCVNNLKQIGLAIH